MNTVLRLELAIVIISALAFSGAGVLVVKYLPQLMQHFSQVCQEDLVAFLNDRNHRNAIGIMFVGILSLTAGAVSALASFLKNYRKMIELRASIQTDLPPEVKSLARQCGIRRTDIKIVRSPDPFVYCHGFSRPQVFISTGLLGRLSAKELEAVLIHEAHHYHHHHPSLVFIAKLLARTFFFIPIIKELSRLLDTVIEINADQAVIFAQESSTHLRRALGKSLRVDPLPAAVALRRTPLEARIALITTPLSAPRLRISQSSISFTLVILAGLGVLLGSAPQASAHPSNDNALCVRDACQVRCERPPSVMESVSYTPTSLSIRD